MCVQYTLHTVLIYIHNILSVLQVFLYGGTESCFKGEYIPFFLIALLVIVFVILPTPFVLCVLTARRWSVSTYIGAACVFPPVYMQYT